MTSKSIVLKLAVAGFAQIAMSVVGIAASCEDKGVVAEVINQITCENLVICSSIQLPNYESIGRMNPEQIATWYAGTTIGQNEDSIRKRNAAGFRRSASCLHQASAHRIRILASKSDYKCTRCLRRLQSDDQTILLHS